jgi:hypothetical protein
VRVRTITSSSRAGRREGDPRTAPPVSS